MNSPPTRITGHIKFFAHGRGFGFVVCDSGKELFFHETNLADHDVMSGTRVSFIIGRSRSGQARAEDVRRIARSVRRPKRSGLRVPIP
jgi:cold shock CspA family protein